MKNDRVSISFRVFSRRHTREELMLAIQPVGANWKKQPPRLSQSSESQSKAKVHASFALFQGEIGRFADILDQALARMAPNRQALQRLTEEGAEAELFIGWLDQQDGGFELTLAQMEAMTALNLRFSLCIYTSE